MVGIIIAVVAAVVLVGGAGVAALFAAGVLGGSGDPEQTVRDLYAAVRDGDCDRMIALYTEESWNEGGTVNRDEALSDCEEGMALTGGLNFQVEATRLISEDGNEAVVEADYTVPGSDESGTDEFTLRQVDGDWLIHNPSTASF